MNPNSGNKKVVVTGVLGQDGANMCEYLLENTDHQVFGVMRRSATPNYINIKSFRDNPRFKLVFADLGDEVSINNLVKDVLPDYFLNFAANSFVAASWDMPVQVFDVNALGVLRCLEAIKKFQPNCRFYSAGSSEEWGNVDYSPQDIKHPIKPRSPYGGSKAAARHIVKIYRESYNMYAVHGILFNHEGVRRSEEFVTRKITKGVARISKALSSGSPYEPISLGNLDAKRDWSDSEDFMDGVWRIINQDHFDTNPSTSDFCFKHPVDYVLASGEAHSVREFVEAAFKEAGVEGFWTGEGVDEKFFLCNHLQENIIGINPNPLVIINPKFYRPAEVELLIGDSTPARKELGWNPKISFHQLVKKMVNHDLSLI